MILKDTKLLLNHKKKNVEIDELRARMDSQAIY